MQNVGQTIYVAGPLFLRMVLAVISAVVVDSAAMGPSADFGAYDLYLGMCVCACVRVCA